jgi:hypothetical protein
MSRLLRSTILRWSSPQLFIRRRRFRPSVAPPGSWEGDPPDIGLIDEQTTDPIDPGQSHAERPVLEHKGCGQIGWRASGRRPIGNTFSCSA